MDDHAEAPIVCRGLTKRWGPAIGIQDLDLTVEAGTVTGFLGPNGAGKTTVIRLLTGLTRPTAGTALLFGRASRDAAVRARLGYMPADPAFYGQLSGSGNLDLLAGLHGASTPDRAWAADLLGLTADALARPVGEYSSGMVQKLAIVQAVQHHPDLVILDEPANRLDPLAHRRFEQIVRAIAASGRTVFLSSHALAEVQDLCDSVAMVRAGRLLAVSSVAELSGAEPRRLRAHYEGAPASLPDGLIDPELHDGVLTARLPGGRVDVLRELLADPAIRDLTVEPASLEEAFVDLYGTTG